MNDMILSGQEEKRMTSMEISELVESRHDSVKRTIERIAKSGIIKLPPLVEVKNHLGQNVSVYLLDKRSSLIVVAQLSPEFTARVVDRWQELEAQATQPSKSIHEVLSDPAAMRNLLLTYTEKVLALESTVAEQAPKVSALNRISLADGFLNLTNTAKTLQINPNAKLFRYMMENKWIYRRAGGKNYVAYQPRIQQGLLSHKVTTVQTSGGQEKIVEQVLVTPKGLAKLADVFTKARA